MIGDITRSFPRATLDLYRRAAPVNVRGRAMPGPVTISSARAVVVPTAGRDMLRLPEALRTRETLRLISHDDDYSPRTLDGETPPDEFRYRGDVWQVQQVSVWTDHGTFHDAMAVLKHRSRDHGFSFFGVAAAAPTTEAEVRALAGQFLGPVAGTTLSIVWPAGQHVVYCAPAALTRVTLRDVDAADVEEDATLATTAAAPVTIDGVAYDVIVSDATGDAATHTFAAREALP